MSKQYRLEDDLIRKSRPKRNSKRFMRLEAALHAQSNWFVHGRCERCGTILINPHSILLHQGGFCQKRIANSQDFNLDQIGEALQKLNS